MSLMLCFAFQLTRSQLQLREKTDTEASLSTLLDDAKSRLQNLDLKLEEKTQRIDFLTQEADVLRQETTRVAGSCKFTSSAPTACNKLELCPLVTLPQHLTHCGC